jgi:hypothetical protein
MSCNPHGYWATGHNIPRRIYSSEHQMMEQNADELVTKFIKDTVDATSLLYKAYLYSHLMVIIFSSIDSMGLLIAPPKQTTATGESFKNWVKKYMLSNSDLEFNEIDFWAARCSVLHSFTSKSDLSKAGKAKQIQYYSGPKDTPIAQAFVEATKDIEGGVHVPGHIEDIYMAFLNGIPKFVEDILENCKKDAVYEKRLRDILQHFVL